MTGRGHLAKVTDDATGEYRPSYARSGLRALTAIERELVAESPAMKPALVPVVMIVLVLAACSGGSSDASTTSTTLAATTTTAVAATIADATSATTTTTPAPKLEDAVRAYTEAFLGGDSDASYALLSERCHGEEASADWKDIVDQAHALYGDATITSYTDDVNGNIATATYELSDPTLNQTNERWLIEGGRWVNDEC